MHICDMRLSILARIGQLWTGLPIAVGAGYACKTFGKGQVCACFFGDGASNRGIHESLNLAAAWKLPVIYALENNFYGISGSQRSFTTLADLPSAQRHIRNAGRNGGRKRYYGCDRRNG